MRQHKSNMIARMQQFLTTDKCRRRFMLKYFDENELLLKTDSNSPDCCDNCTRK
jgi:superfamily II DNA helicase RecQ